MISIGAGLFPTEPAARIAELTRHAEDLGYRNAWIGDSQNIWRESTVTMAAAATATSRIGIGTGVTNVATRHRSVLASTWATMAELSGGRVALGVGVGDSSLFTMGLQPTRLAELERGIGDLRALLRGEEATEPTSGGRYRLLYVDTPIHVPVYVGATGPRILRLAGRVADGVILLAGTDPRFIEAAMRRLAEGAAEAGRTLADLHIVLWTPTAIADDPTAARDLVRAHVARVALRPLPAEVDPDEQAAIDRIRKAYDYYEHMDTEALHARLVPDSLVDLFALAGTPEQCLARLKVIASTGVQQVSIIPYVAPGGDRAATLTTFAELHAAL